MSEIPEELPSQPQDATLPEETSAGEVLTTRETVPETAETSTVLVVPIADPAPQSDDAPLLFQSFTRPIAPPQERIPHTVSYTHLDVYKRQALQGLMFG